MAEEIERIYVIPLKKTGFKSSSAAPHAIKTVKSFLTRHMKVEEDEIWIDDSLNNAIWARGKYHIPSKIRVKAVKFEDGVVEAYLPELEFKKSRRELLKEEKEKKEPILKREEEEIGEEPGEVPGAEEYDISPAADGDVKIKKKKPLKKKEEKKPEGKTKRKEKPVKKEKKEGKTETKKTKKTIKIRRKEKTSKPKRKEEGKIKTKKKK